MAEMTSGIFEISHWKDPGRREGSSLTAGEGGKAVALKGRDI